jgi:hypothetical protein
MKTALNGRPLKKIVRIELFVLACVFFTAYADYAIAPKDSILAFFGTDHVKTVFVLDGKLCFIDFSESSPQIRTVAAASNPANPVISPQGTSVTFSTGLSDDPPSSLPVPSTAWLCSLSVGGAPTMVDSPAYVPRFVQDATDPTVLYSTCGNATRPSAHLYDWDGCGMVYRKNMITNEKTVLWDKGSWFGGLSYDGSWLATAEMYPNAFLLKITPLSPGPVVLHSLKFKNNSTSKDTLIPVQTCNPSVSSSRVFFDAMMYFDFGVDAICRIGNFSIFGYGQDNGWFDHTIIFISRSDGRIVKQYGIPDEIKVVPPDLVKGKGEIMDKNWDYPEWSNHPYYAAATVELDRYWRDLGDTRSLNEMVYAVDLFKSKHLCLVRQNTVSSANTQNIRWPWLWVETPADFGSREDTTWLSNYAGTRFFPARNVYSALPPFTFINSHYIRVATLDVQAVRFFSPNGKRLRTVLPLKSGVVSLRGLPPVVIVMFVMRHGISSSVTLTVMP